MDKKGLDNTPNITPEFSNVKDTAPAKEQSEEVKGIATKAEFEQTVERDEKLRATLQTPKMMQTVKIDGSIKNEVDKKAFDKAKQDFENNQKRMQYLERRLTQRNLTREFDRNR